MLPKEIKLETGRGARTAPVKAFPIYKAPDHRGGAYERSLDRFEREREFSNHRRDTTPAFLTSWTFSQKMRDVAERVERAAEEGIPDQKRCALRNQDFGLLDDTLLAEIGAGFEVEKPFWRWSKMKSSECRVAICIDSAVSCKISPELLQARTILGAGACSALEALDYEVSMTYACAQSRVSERLLPREAVRPWIYAQVVKEESEPFVSSAFAAMSDTDIRRLLSVWNNQANVGSASLSDAEWRELTGADLFIFIGPRSGFNNDGAPYGLKYGPTGEDVLGIECQRVSDIDKALTRIEEFFQKMAT